MKQPWGCHLTIDFSGCDKQKISDIDHIKSFSKDLVDTIRANSLGDPQISYSGSANNAGYTLFQLTHFPKFNILAQFCEETGEMYFDIIGCGILVPEHVIYVVEKYFLPSNHMRNFIIRDANPINTSWPEEYTR